MLRTARQSESSPSGSDTSGFPLDTPKTWIKKTARCKSGVPGVGVGGTQEKSE